VAPEEVGESGGSSPVEPPPKGHPPLVIRSSKQPSVATLSKPIEEKKHKRVKLEDSDAEASFVADTQSGTVDCGTSSKKQHNKRGVCIGIVPYSPVGSGNLVVGPTVGANLIDGTDASYHTLGPPSYECSNCHATMWYEERSNKARKAANP
ncbi:hypothetical protein Tco_0828308, partial [Tanacetum coccineum]